MSDMKCPFCKEKIISDLCLMFDKKDKDYTNGRQIYKCNKCGLFGNKKLVQELIRTKKQLKKAVNALRHIDWFFDGDYNVYTKDMHNEIKYALKAINQINNIDKGE